MPNWRSIRRGGSAGRTASLRGRPRWRGGGATGAAGGNGLVGFSRASIAVLSRETWPTKRSVWVCWISASCSREGKALSANLAKAREKVASLGTSLARCQPHSCRNVLSLASRVISRRVVGKLNIALATKARARAARSAGGRPTRTRQEGSNAPIRHKPSTATNCLWPGGRRAPHQDRPGGQQRLDPDQAEHCNQLLVAGRQRAVRGLVQPGQKRRLQVNPVCGKCLFKRHRLCPRRSCSGCMLMPPMFRKPGTKSRQIQTRCARNSRARAILQVAHSILI